MFTEGLKIGLALTVDGTAYKIRGGQVKNLSIDLHVFGYEADLDFWVSCDDRTDVLYEFFTTPSLIQVGLTLASADEPEEDAPDALTLTGFVTGKRLFEETYEKVGSKVLYRRYWLRFADPAQVFWHQHFPCELYTDSNMKAVFEAQKGEKISITYDMPALETNHPVIFLGLGTPGNETSFYDFLMWYTASQNAVWTYNSYTNSYTLSQEKEAVGDAGALDTRDVDGPEIVFPETPRFNLKVVNALARDSEAKDVTQDQAVTGIRRDVLLRTPVKAHFDDRCAIEEAGLVLPEHELKLVFRRFPTITFRPGSYVAFAEEAWSSELYYKSSTYRVGECSLQLSAVDQEHTKDLDAEVSEYDIDMTATLEVATDKIVSRPAYVTPYYPGLVEGLIVSEEGDEAEETYQFYEDSDSQLDQYKVKIPLWDDQTVIVRYNPNMFPGHFYFPYVKDARVLVALEFQSAWIKRVLEWRPNAQLPMDGQGNHILFGKTDKDQTSLTHFYEDQKPVLSLKRLLDKDTELIRLEEGTLILQTKEEE
ncbi:hypothetical protein ACFL59_04565 [Planctomycetota bacterium]